MTNSSFRVVLHKAQLTFSAAHFITFGDNICERLHGHNYGIRCEVYGKLNEHGYVVDFIALRDSLAAIADSMDHRVLLPTKHRAILITSTGNEVMATFEERRWIFPKEDCCLLPISNTTAELLARHIADRLMERAETLFGPQIDRILVGVDENQGQWGECEVQLRG